MRCGVGTLGMLADSRWLGALLSLGGALQMHMQQAAGQLACACALPAALRPLTGTQINSLPEQQVVAARSIQAASEAREHHGPEAQQCAGEGGGHQVSAAQLRQAGDEADIHQRAYGCAKRVAAELALRKVPGVGERGGQRRRSAARRSLQGMGRPQLDGGPHSMQGA